MTKFMIALAATCTVFSAHAASTFPSGAQPYSACKTLNGEYSHVFTILKDAQNQLFLQDTYTPTNVVHYSSLGADPLPQPAVSGRTQVTSLAGKGEFRVDVDMVGSYLCGVAGEPGMNE